MEKKEYLLVLAQTHEQFRIPELQSLATMEGIDVNFSNHRADTPFMIVKLNNDDEAKRLVQRSILCRGIYELWGYGTDVDSLHADVKSRSAQLWDLYKESSFKFDFYSYQGSKTKSEQIALINSFSYLGFQGPIRMKNAEQIFAILEDYDVIDREPKEHPENMWFGRFISDTHRSYVDKYDLKKRKYIGTTSFEAELSLVTCNMGMVGPGKIMYDPFVGTGSFLVAGGHFGALTVGSDLDARAVRGKGKNNIDANFAQYRITNKLLDVMAVDFTHNSFRKDLKLDSIVCDPPYGIREGLKVLGTKNPARFEGKEKIVIDGELAHLRKDYIASKKPYELASLLDDLLQFSADHLVSGGRLCFWMPTANDDFQPNHIPLHPDLELISECVQVFNKWSRRLLTYSKRYESDERGQKQSGQSNEEFRDKYFRGFSTKPQESI
ncbi:putative ribonuclease methylating protein [Nadsonia fulvescens var. elongata DSM 6958]|uniref:tRNA (guanine(10)-N(2))-methyltransferase n=1 Tax=Nadsonia fulvescens var. elongata DSM 6958 TaxID=857566 RepID=A0A1E3PPQ2_9ASCO|nr:putative ribonuclease methylating protein [Nadsonia fulvescens var. elongata DSM 6958]